MNRAFSLPRTALVIRMSQKTLITLWPFSETTSSAQTEKLAFTSKHGCISQYN
jgi:hypothetical protein